MVRISLCMIVRDEEQNLARCLESVREVVDEVCVVDTGSTDATVEIAHRHGARVEHFEWCDDFSAARNASLGMATGDWVLVLDADEAIEDPAARSRLEAFAAAHPRKAGQVVVVDRQEQGDLRSRVSRFLPRVMRPAYEGCFHEQPCFGRRPAVAASTDLEVIHYGYRPDAIAARGKLERNCRYIERQLAEAPEDPYLWYQLGRTRMVGADHEGALDAFTRALDHVETSAPYLALLIELTGHCMRRLGRSLEALALLRQVSGAFLHRPDTCYLEALLALDVGHLELAEARFQRCLTLDSVDGVGGSSAEAARTWGPAYHLGVLRECLGLPDEARAYYRMALDHRPDHAESLDALGRLEGDVL